MRSRQRRGFSLMEVLLASAILVTCLIVLGELAEVGRRHARDAEQWGTAQLVCRSLLNEILAGAAPLESQAATEAADLPGWSQMVRIEAIGSYGLSCVTVSVTRAAPADLETPGGARGKSFSLSRLVFAPDRDASTAAPSPEGSSQEGMASEGNAPTGDSPEMTAPPSAAAEGELP